jgi:hypothetical protein
VLCLSHSTLCTVLLQCFSNNTAESVYIMYLQRTIFLYDWKSFLHIQSTGFWTMFINTHWRNSLHLLEREQHVSAHVTPPSHLSLSVIANGRRRSKSLEIIRFRIGIIFYQNFIGAQENWDLKGKSCWWSHKILILRFFSRKYL